MDASRQSKVGGHANIENEKRSLDSLILLARASHAGFLLGGLENVGSLFHDVVDGNGTLAFRTRVFFRVLAPVAFAFVIAHQVLPKAIAVEFEAIGFAAFAFGVIGVEIGQLSQDDNIFCLVRFGRSNRLAAISGVAQSSGAEGGSVWVFAVFACAFVGAAF